MSSSQVGIKRVCDSSLLRIFVNTLSDTESFKFGPQAGIALTIGGTGFQIKNTEGTDTETTCHLVEGQIEHPFLKSLFEDSSSNNKIQKITLTDRSIHQYFSIVYERSSQSFIDTLTTSNQQTNLESLIIYSHVSEQLSSYAITDYVSDGAFEMASVHNDVLTRLEGLSINLIKKQSETAKQFETEKKEFIDEQLEDFKNRTTILEREHKEKLESLDLEYKEKSKQLDIRQKEIEDADNTTARRKTTTNILGSVEAKAKRFNFSNTVTSRSILAYVFAVLLAALGLWNTYDATVELKMQIEFIEKATLPDLGSDTAENNDIETLKTSAINSKVIEQATSSRESYLMFLYIKIFLSSALLVSSLVYLVRWFNAWADKLAQQELDNQIFVRDLNRAHLAVEMSLEWNEKKDGPVPDKLLDAMTSNL